MKQSVLKIVCGLTLAIGLTAAHKLPSEASLPPAQAPQSAASASLTDETRGHQIDPATQRDLAAQEKMAAAAEIQLSEVRNQTRAIWLGIFFSAAASAIAGFALLVAMGTGRRQLRAYVMPDNIVILHPTFDPSYAKLKPRPADHPGVLIGLKNSGPTPATKVLHWAQCEVHPIQYEGTLKTPATLDRISESAIAPGGIITKTLFLNAPLSPAQAQDIRDHKAAIYVHGVVTYLDAFRQKRTTHFRLRYSGMWPPAREASFTFCDDGNNVS